MLDANHTITPWYMELLIDPNDKVFLQGWQDPGGSDVYAADELGVLMLCVGLTIGISYFALEPFFFYMTLLYIIMCPGCRSLF
jgi:hypothetical protein